MALNFSSPVQFKRYTQAAGEMKTMIKDASNDPQILDAAINLIRPFSAYDYVNQAKALFLFVRDQIDYVRAPANQDLYRYPALMLKQKAGDCDNKVILLGSLARAVGFATRMVFLFTSPKPNFFSDFPKHVYLEIDTAYDESDPFWTACETIPVPAGGNGEAYLDFGQRMQGGYPEWVEVEV